MGMGILLWFILFAIMGFVVGCGRLLYKKQSWYSGFLEEHPILGWTATVLVGSGVVTALFFGAIVVAALVLLMFGIQ